MPPLPSELRNYGGPTHALRRATNEMRARGSSYDMRELPKDCLNVGHIFFYPSTRKPPIPPFAELEAYMAANPDLPIVVNDNREDGNKCEYPHILVAQFVRDDNGQVGVDAHGNAIISVFTIAVDCFKKAFDPATHFKNGTQYAGVDIFDWDMCNFNDDYVDEDKYRPHEVYRRIYQDLCCML